MLWRLDRLGRSLADLMQIVADLEQRSGQIGFPCVRGTGRVRARLNPGADAGRACGCKPKLDDQQVREIKALLRDPDIQVAEVARRYGVSRTTLYKHVGVITPRQ
ncbi:MULTISPECIES: helix-turn-helix domain-containing protein [Photorhabdus]|uniref:helix-turn-helix domain-containing protein n=1 Tax=Photorhabdus TaxID=29487 RepID=UPI0003232B7A|nr:MULTISPECIES: recombinase family protein [Photorhabdus]